MRIAKIVFASPPSPYPSIVLSSKPLMYYLTMPPQAVSPRDTFYRDYMKDEMGNLCRELMPTCAVCRGASKDTMTGCCASCTKCKAVQYCGVACQTVDWYSGFHKQICTLVVADIARALSISSFLTSLTYPSYLKQWMLKFNGLSSTELGLMLGHYMDGERDAKAKSIVVTLNWREISHLRQKDWLWLEDFYPVAHSMTGYMPPSKLVEVEKALAVRSNSLYTAVRVKFRVNLSHTRWVCRDPCNQSPENPCYGSNGQENCGWQEIPGLPQGNNGLRHTEAVLLNDFPSMGAYAKVPRETLWWCSEDIRGDNETRLDEIREKCRYTQSHYMPHPEYPLP